MVQTQITREKLTDKVAIVTGASRGIGAAIAKLLARNGAHVIVADILDDIGQAMAASIGGRFVHCDISQEHDVAQAVDLAISWHGQLDIMVNNAGVPGRGGCIAKLDMEALRATMDVNLLGTIHGIKHAARAMTKTGGGSIICVASTAALMGGLASHTYTMTKAAVVGLVKSVAGELGKYDIRVNCVSPHGIPTQMLIDAYRQSTGREDLTKEEVGQMVATGGSRLKGRSGSEEDIAEAVVFLANQQSAGFMTGHNLIVDGGFTSSHNGFKWGDE